MKTFYPRRTIPAPYVPQKGRSPSSRAWCQSAPLQPVPGVYGPFRGPPDSDESGCGYDHPALNPPLIGSILSHITTPVRGRPSSSSLGLCCGGVENQHSDFRATPGTHSTGLNSITGDGSLNPLRVKFGTRECPLPRVNFGTPLPLLWRWHSELLPPQTSARSPMPYSRARVSMNSTTRHSWPAEVTI
jgi:hypothetical protein